MKAEILDKSWVGVSLSHATLRDEDLLDAFERFVISVQDTIDYNIVGKLGDKISEARSYLKSEDYATVSIIINEEIWSIIDSIAPEGTVFSAHDGDSSDFGFWVYEEDEIELSHGGTL